MDQTHSTGDEKEGLFLCTVPDQLVTGRKTSVYRSTGFSMISLGRNLQKDTDNPFFNEEKILISPIPG